MDSVHDDLENLLGKMDKEKKRKSKQDAKTAQAAHKAQSARNAKTEPASTRNKYSHSSQTPISDSSRNSLGSYLYKRWNIIAGFILSGALLAGIFFDNFTPAPSLSNNSYPKVQQTSGIVKSSSSNNKKNYSNNYSSSKKTNSYTSKDNSSLTKKSDSQRVRVVPVKRRSYTSSSNKYATASSTSKSANNTSSQITATPVLDDLLGGKVSGTYHLSSHQLYDVKHTISISEDGELVIPEGTTLYFEKGAGIVCYGSISAKGTSEDNDKVNFMGDSWTNILLCGTNASATFDHCTFSNGTGSILKNNSSFDIPSANKYTKYGGAIASIGAKNLIIKNSTFYKNDAPYGAALFVYKTNNVNITTSKFCSNEGSTSWPGSIISIKNSGSIQDVQITSSCFQKNKGNSSIYIQNSPTHIWKNNLNIDDAIMIESNNVVVNQNKLNNIAGSGMIIRGDAEVSENIISNCYVGIFSQDKSANIQKNTLKNNNYGIKFLHGKPKRIKNNTFVESKVKDIKRAH